MPSSCESITTTTEIDMGESNQEAVARVRKAAARVFETESQIALSNSFSSGTNHAAKVAPTDHPHPGGNSIQDAISKLMDCNRYRGSKEQSAVENEQAEELTNNQSMSDSPVIQDGEWDDYNLFIKALEEGTEKDWFLDDDHEDAFIFQNESDDDADDLDFDLQSEMGSQLGSELGSLLEEDFQATVTTLVGTTTQMSPKPNSGGGSVLVTPTTPTVSSPSPSMGTPIRRPSKPTTNMTSQQHARLTSLLSRHYQLLVQQAALSIRALHKSRVKPYTGETPEDLAEILDGAVGMLQDLDENRKDAIRTSIQLDQSKKSTNRSLLPQMETGRLTRAAFSKTLQSRTAVATCFDIPALSLLPYTFAQLDNPRGPLLELSESDACLRLLEDAQVDHSFVPGTQDVSTLISDPSEFFGPDFEAPANEAQVAALRKDRNHFTSAEDSLVFRGVNLFGEKQWAHIADRYLPDRSINIISQRYSKLSFLVYKAHGVRVDAAGELEVPPKHESVERVNNAALAGLKKVEPPALLNVHRWSIEEDLTLLRAVPILGHMWAELSSRFIPHRDRGHLRKRYQVLGRRIKATVTRAAKDFKYKPMVKRTKTPVTKSVVKSIPNPPVRSTPSKIKGADAKGRSTNATAARTTPAKASNLRKPGRKLPTRKEEKVTEPQKPVENILDDELSQKSRMMRVLETGGTLESEIGNAIFSRHDNGSKAESFDKLPNMTLDSRSSGFSLLANTAVAKASPLKKREPIMATVLQRTKRKEDTSEKSTNDENMVTPKSGSKSAEEQKNSTPNTTAAANSLTSLSRSASSQRHSDQLLSPTSSRLNSLPSPSLGRLSPGFQSAFSPSAVGNSTDGFEFCDFAISDRSRQAMEKNSNSMMNPLLNTSSRPSISFGANSLMENDFEAISALNALSNSPAKCLIQRPSFSTLSASTTPTAVSTKNSAKRSLFDQVVEGCQKRQAKKHKTASPSDAATTEKSD